MRRTNTATKPERIAPPPASQTRPKFATTRPVPVDETTPDTFTSIDAARLADDYDAIRVKLEEFGREEERIRLQLIEAMKTSCKKNFNTMHGRVSFLEKTEDKQVADEKAAVALLESRGIPQPPTMEAWLAQHRIPMPMTTKKGLPDRIKFEMNK
jgi:hypothetical protein